jgi:hypothetical protein
LTEIDIDSHIQEEIIKLAHALNVQPADVVAQAIIRLEEAEEVKQLMKLSGAMDSLRKTVLRTK